MRFEGRLTAAVFLGCWLSVVSAPDSVYAQLTTFRFEGTVGEVIDWSGGFFPDVDLPGVGASFAGTYTFDPLAVDTGAQPEQGVYRTEVRNAVKVSIADFAWHADQSVVSIIDSDPPNADIYEVGGVPLIRDTHAEEFQDFPDIWFFQLRLVGSGDILSDASLPTEPPDLGQWDQAGLTVQGDHAFRLGPAPLVIITATLESLMKVPDARTFGDYNRDGAVDSADYGGWRDTLGQTGSSLLADGDGNGQIDEADYEVWKDHFGQIVNVGAGSFASAGLAAAAPEPTSVSLLAIGSLTPFCLQRRGRRASCHFHG